MKDAILPEFDHEMSNTRKTLERVPDDKFTWKPHQKSFSMGALATHLTELPMWAVTTLAQDSLDLEPPGGQPYKRVIPNNTKELLENFDKNLAKARAAIDSTSDAELMKPWSLLKAGKTLMPMPKVAVLRGFVMNHNIHHRAQLGVYLRLNDIPVPSIYGPSADEGQL